MDCVGCDKCRLWGKVQTHGMGTALKILFADLPRNGANKAQIGNGLTEMPAPFKLTRFLSNNEMFVILYLISGMTWWPCSKALVAMLQAFGRLTNPGGSLAEGILKKM